MTRSQSQATKKRLTEKKKKKLARIDHVKDCQQQVNSDASQIPQLTSKLDSSCRSPKYYSTSDGKDNWSVRQFVDPSTNETVIAAKGSEDARKVIRQHRGSCNDHQLSSYKEIQTSELSKLPLVYGLQQKVMSQSAYEGVFGLQNNESARKWKALNNAEARAKQLEDEKKRTHWFIVKVDPNLDYPTGEDGSPIYVSSAMVSLSIYEIENATEGKYTKKTSCSTRFMGIVRDLNITIDSNAIPDYSGSVIKNKKCVLNGHAVVPYTFDSVSEAEEHAAKFSETTGLLIGSEGEAWHNQVKRQPAGNWEVNQQGSDEKHRFTNVKKFLGHIGNPYSTTKMISDLNEFLRHHNLHMTGSKHSKYFANPSAMEKNVVINEGVLGADATYILNGVILDHE